MVMKGITEMQTQRGRERVSEREKEGWFVWLVRLGARGWFWILRLSRCRACIQADLELVSQQLQSDPVYWAVLIPLLLCTTSVLILHTRLWAGSALCLPWIQPEQKILWLLSPSGPASPCVLLLTALFVQTSKNITTSTKMEVDRREVSAQKAHQTQLSASRGVLLHRIPTKTDVSSSQRGCIRHCSPSGRLPCAGQRSPWLPLPPQIQSPQEEAGLVAIAPHQQTSLSLSLSLLLPHM